MTDTFSLYDLRVTVVEIRGRSVCGMKIGDSFELRNSSQLALPDSQHFCIYALAAVLPLLAAKQRELSDNDWLASDNLVVCPDPDEGLVMKIERLEKVELSKSDLT
ncbi:MAG: TIGR04076 family protein [Acidobacteria bacterium]|nr:MAG: TIGR04076 family protein [Acidobacteriota bacterium]